MAKEIEVKILNIDPKLIRRQLSEAGAKLEQPLSKQRRYVFDIDPKDKSRWIRLRSDGRTATLAVKIINSSAIDGTDEHETEVSSFDDTLSILKQLGFSPKSYQENYRQAYSLGGASVSVDCWPRLKPYLEVEANTEDEVLGVLEKLGMSKEPRTSVNTKQLYLNQDVDLDRIDKLVFSKSEEELINRA